MAHNTRWRLSPSHRHANTPQGFLAFRQTALTLPGDGPLRVYLCAIHYADADRWLPSANMIAEQYNIHRSTVLRSLSALIKLGIIERVEVPIQTKNGYAKADIPDHLRWTVWERDDFTCQDCGSRRRLSIDHITPESKGGTLDPSNLRTLCHPCNARKGAR